jgi:hypothetical protein
VLASQLRYISYYTDIHIYRANYGYQISHWTLNNAANNGTFVEELARLLQASDIDFDPHNRHIMCFPHVVNICCQHVLANITNIKLADTADVSLSALPPVLPNQQTFEEANSMVLAMRACLCVSIYTRVNRRGNGNCSREYMYNIADLPYMG